MQKKKKEKRKGEKKKKKVEKLPSSFHLPSPTAPPRLHAPSESQPRNRPDQLLYQVLPPGSACKSKDAINRSLIAILSRTFNIQFLTGKGPPRMASIPSPLLLSSPQPLQFFQTGATSRYLLAGHDEPVSGLLCALPSLQIYQLSIESISRRGIEKLFSFFLARRIV